MRPIAILICRFADLISTCLDGFHRATSVHAFLRLLRRSHLRPLWGDHNPSHLFDVHYCSSQYIPHHFCCTYQDFSRIWFPVGLVTIASLLMPSQDSQVMSFHDCVTRRGQGVFGGEEGSIKAFVLWDGLMGLFDGLRKSVYYCRTICAQYTR